MYDGDRVAEELDGTEDLLASYVYGRYVDEVLRMDRDTNADMTFEAYYYHADDLYSVGALTDDTGAVVERYAYGDYGQPQILDASDDVRLYSAGDRVWHYPFRVGLFFFAYPG